MKEKTTAQLYLPKALQGPQPHVRSCCCPAGAGEPKSAVWRTVARPRPRAASQEPLLPQEPSPPQPQAALPARSNKQHRLRAWTPAAPAGGARGGRHRRHSTFIWRCASWPWRSAAARTSASWCFSCSRSRRCWWGCSFPACAQTAAECAGAMGDAGWRSLEQQPCSCSPLALAASLPSCAQPAFMRPACLPCPPAPRPSCSRPQPVQRSCLSLPYPCSARASRSPTGLLCRWTLHAGLGAQVLRAGARCAPEHGAL